MKFGMKADALRSILCSLQKKRTIEAYSKKEGKHLHSKCLTAMCSSRKAGNLMKEWVMRTWPLATLKHHKFPHLLTRACTAQQLPLAVGWRWICAYRIMQNANAVRVVDVTALLYRS